MPRRSSAWASPRCSSRTAIAREPASSSFVLLKNDGPILPFELAPGQRLAVIGPNTASTEAQGGGSARVNPVSKCSVFQALRDRLNPLGVTVLDEIGRTTWSGTPALEGHYTLAYLAEAGFDRDGFDPTVLHSETAKLGSFRWHADPGPTGEWPTPGSWLLQARTPLVATHSGSWKFSLTQVGAERLLVDGVTVVDARDGMDKGEAYSGFASKERFGTIDLEEGRAYEVTVEYAKQPKVPLAGLTIGAVPPIGTEEDLLRRAEALASSADAVVCVVGTSGKWESEGRDRSSMELPGLHDHLVRWLVLANPRTCVLVNAGSPVAMDWEAGVAGLAQIWFPGEQGWRGSRRRPPRGKRPCRATADDNPSTD